MGGQNGIVVPNNDNEDHNQQLIQGQDNSDVSLSVKTPAMIQTYTIRNPIYLKKETLSLEKDTENNNIYYIKFNYDSLVDFDLYINFNVQLNKQGKKLYYQIQMKINIYYLMSLVKIFKVKE